MLYQIFADDCMPLLRYIQEHNIGGVVSLHNPEGMICWIELDPEDMLLLCLSVPYDKIIYENPI